jgi:NDP-sugar pyrophosphorylase family protein
MKALILAGDLGTRISEETHLKPKPMIEIGCKPMLWHLVKIYSSHGIDDFIVCCGYKGFIIKEKTLQRYVFLNFSFRSIFEIELISILKIRFRAGQSRR